MNRQFLVRIEQLGRIDYQAVRGQRQALEVARDYATRPDADQIAVLDATGHVVWKATGTRSAAGQLA